MIDFEAFPRCRPAGSRDQPSTVTSANARHFVASFDRPNIQYRIVGKEEPKDPDSSTIFQIVDQFAAPEIAAETRRRLREGGMGWGELKNQLFEVLNTQLSPLRERYNALMNPDSELDTLLAAGAEKARKRAVPVLAQVRKAIGID
ncbi:MAG: hypothetical protein ACRDQ4_07040 [Pseudonocardiaceae bacterium]